MSEKYPYPLLRRAIQKDLEDYPPETEAERDARLTANFKIMKKCQGRPEK